MAQEPMADITVTSFGPRLFLYHPGYTWVYVTDTDTWEGTEEELILSDITALHTLPSPIDTLIPLTESTILIGTRDCSAFLYEVTKAGSGFSFKKQGDVCEAEEIHPFPIPLVLHPNPQDTIDQKVSCFAMRMHDERLTLMCWSEVAKKVLLDEKFSIPAQVSDTILSSVTPDRKLVIAVANDQGLSIYVGGKRAVVLSPEDIIGNDGDDDFEVTFYDILADRFVFLSKCALEDSQRSSFIVYDVAKKEQVFSKALPNVSSCVVLPFAPSECQWQFTTLIRSDDDFYTFEFAYFGFMRQSNFSALQLIEARLESTQQQPLRLPLIWCRDVLTSLRNDSDLTSVLIPLGPKDTLTRMTESSTLRLPALSPNATSQIPRGDLIYASGPNFSLRPCVAGSSFFTRTGARHFVLEPERIRKIAVTTGRVHDLLKELHDIIKAKDPSSSTLQLDDMGLVPSLLDVSAEAAEYCPLVTFHLTSTNQVALYVESPFAFVREDLFPLYTLTPRKVIPLEQPKLDQVSPPVNMKTEQDQSASFSMCDSVVSNPEQPNTKLPSTNAPHGLFMPNLPLTKSPANDTIRASKAEEETRGHIKAYKEGLQERLGNLDSPITLFLDSSLPDHFADCDLFLRQLVLLNMLRFTPLMLAYTQATFDKAAERLFSIDKRFFFDFYGAFDKNVLPRTPIIRGSDVLSILELRVFPDPDNMTVCYTVNSLNSKPTITGPFLKGLLDYIEQGTERLIGAADSFLRLLGMVQPYCAARKDFQSELRDTLERYPGNFPHFLPKSGTMEPKAMESSVSVQGSALESTTIPDNGRTNTSSFGILSSILTTPQTSDSTYDMSRPVPSFRDRDSLATSNIMKSMRARGVNQINISHLDMDLRRRNTDATIVFSLPKKTAEIANSLVYRPAQTLGQTEEVETARPRTNLIFEKLRTLKFTDDTYAGPKYTSIISLQAKDGILEDGECHFPRDTGVVARICDMLPCTLSQSAEIPVDPQHTLFISDLTKGHPTLFASSSTISFPRLGLAQRQTSAGASENTKTSAEKPSSSETSKSQGFIHSRSELMKDTPVLLKGDVKQEKKPDESVPDKVAEPGKPFEATTVELFSRGALPDTKGTVPEPTAISNKVPSANNTPPVEKPEQQAKPATTLSQAIKEEDKPESKTEQKKHGSIGFKFSPSFTPSTLSTPAAPLIAAQTTKAEDKPQQPKEQQQPKGQEGTTPAFPATSFGFAGKSIFQPSQAVAEKSTPGFPLNLPSTKTEPVTSFGNKGGFETTPPESGDSQDNKAVANPFVMFQLPNTAPSMQGQGVFGGAKFTFGDK
ncbi:hypothetical protein GMRT_13079 [Giardia muris]|uniref:Uncharacterized protein n=1 Tax=Giardia muris TaxID=5742 RepID=A0A4Z1TAW6_GIAMU|nr:hypothetical protein GMRT_13079 [Giardia muris]|eukprot:TNJ30377.1 hypothetical protein GMRT_13079 [Giardia muris]